MLEAQRQNIADHCQQTFFIQKFVDNTQQCFAFTEGSSYSNLDDMMEGYKIKSALPFKIFSTLAVSVIRFTDCWYQIKEVRTTYKIEFCQ